MTVPHLRTSHTRPTHTKFSRPNSIYPALLVTGALIPTADGVMEHECIDNTIARTLEMALSGSASAQTLKITSQSAELRARLSERLHSLARDEVKRLGWRGPDWSPEKRHATVERLRAHAALVFSDVLDEVDACPRGEVVDDATSVLKALALSDEGVSTLATSLAERQHADSKIAIARALGAARGAQIDAARNALVGALTNADGDVREAAAWSLVNLEDSSAVAALSTAAENEADPNIRHSLHEALDTLKGC